MRNPNAFAPLYLDRNSRARTRNDNIGTLDIVGPPATNRGPLAKSTIPNRLSNTYLCVGARTRQRPVVIFLPADRLSTA